MMHIKTVTSNTDKLQSAYIQILNTQCVQLTSQLGWQSAHTNRNPWWHTARLISFIKNSTIIISMLTCRIKISQSLVSVTLISSNRLKKTMTDNLFFKVLLFVYIPVFRDVNILNLFLKFYSLPPTDRCDCDNSVRELYLSHTWTSQMVRWGT